MRPFLAVVVGCLVVAGPASAGPADTFFEKGLEADLGTNSAPDPSQAFDWFMRAAQAGHVQAAFNVAVMLDSGRGTARDVTRAAAWYGRAAARGDKRAAYNLAQLYEAGEGVPANVDVARTWYEASGLPAARDRMATLSTTSPRPAVLSPPIAVAPLNGDVLPDGKTEVELVWTSALQPEPSRYAVEVRSVSDTGSEEFFAWTSSTTAMLVVLPGPSRRFAWRVAVVGRRLGDYNFGEWQVFSLASPEAAGR